MDVQDWKDPETRASAGAARVVADALRAAPGKWAIIEEYEVPVVAEGADAASVEDTKDRAKKVRAKASSRASLIKQGRVAAFRSLDRQWPGTFEAVSRSELDEASGKKVIRVYAKYRGEEFAEEPKAKSAADGSGPEAASVEETVNA